MTHTISDVTLKNAGALVPTCGAFRTRRKGLVENELNVDAIDFDGLDDKVGNISTDQHGGIEVDRSDLR